MFNMFDPKNGRLLTDALVVFYKSPYHSSLETVCSVIDIYSLPSGRVHRKTHEYIPLSTIKLNTRKVVWKC